MDYPCACLVIVYIFSRFGFILGTDRHNRDATNRLIPATTVGVTINYTVYLSDAKIDERQTDNGKPISIQVQLINRN